MIVLMHPPDAMTLLPACTDWKTVRPSLARMQYLAFYASTSRSGVCEIHWTGQADHQLLDKLVNAGLSTGAVLILASPCLHVQIIWHCAPYLRRLFIASYVRIFQSVRMQGTYQDSCI